jgi:hypothetical protein
MKIKPLFVLAIFLCCQVEVRPSTFTNLVASGNGQTASLTVNTGELAKVVTANLYGPGRVSILLGTNRFDYTYFLYNQTVINGTQGAPAVAGPATITLTCQNSGGVPVFCTIELVSPSEPFTPSNAVVIPADSGGPVNIVLESSTDLITWTPALPGTYGTSTEKRFFRVRGERAP